MNEPSRAADRDEFLARFARFLPNSGPAISLSTRLDELADDKVTRASVQRALRRLLPGAPDDLLASIETLDEAFGWMSSEPASDAEDEGPRVRLRPIEDRDVPVLYRSAASFDHGFRWRYRGATPSIQQFHADLFAGVLVQYVVEDLAGEQVFGLVCAYNAQPELGHVYLGFLRASPSRGRGEVLEGMVQFIEHLFRTWSFRKIYAEVPAFNANGMFDPESDAVTIEGRLVDHCFHDGRWWDQLIVALWRDRWARGSARWAGAPEPAPHQG